MIIKDKPFKEHERLEVGGFSLEVGVRRLKA